MTKKHFEAVAAIFATYQNTPNPTAQILRKQIAYEMASLFGRENPRFDRARFLKAAGVEG